MRALALILSAGALACSTVKSLPPELAHAAQPQVAQATQPWAPPPPPAAIAPPPAAAPQAPPQDASYITFDVDDHEQAWVVRTKEGALVCQLPCARWVPKNSGWIIDRTDAPGPSYRVWVSDDPRVHGGNRIRALILPKRGSEVGPAIMLYAGYPFAVIALATGIVCASLSDRDGRGCGTGTAAEVALIGTPLVYMGAALWWFLWARSSTHIEWSPDRYAPSAKVKGPTYTFGPGFLAGTF